MLQTIDGKNIWGPTHPIDREEEDCGDNEEKE